MNVGGLMLVAVGIVAGMVAYEKATGNSHPAPAVQAQNQASQGLAASTSPIDPFCEDMTYNACFINSDGQSCRNEMDTPIGRLFAQGNRTVSRAVRSGNKCVIDLTVEGTIDGNSYRKSGQVWGFKL